MQETERSKLNDVFDKNHRIVALVGNKSNGKTNNMIHLALNHRSKVKDVDMFAYGLPKSVSKWLKKKHNIREISTLNQLVTKKNCILFIDEFEKLKLNDRRYKDELDEFVDFVYHNNVYVILCSPNIREFNSIIGGAIERWLLKSVRLDQCINGSQLKKIVDGYKGSNKVLKSIVVPKDTILVINDEEEKEIICEYVPEADTKANNEELF